MLLNELFYFDNNGKNFVDDKRYNAQRDVSVVRPGDTRKTRLTLKQINQIRRTAEARDIERTKEQDFIRLMYGQPAQDAQAI